LRYLRKSPGVECDAATILCPYLALTVLTIDLAAEIGLKSAPIWLYWLPLEVGWWVQGFWGMDWGERFHHKPCPLIGF